MTSLCIYSKFRSAGTTRVSKKCRHSSIKLITKTSAFILRLKLWSSICIRLLLFHDNQNNVYTHSFLVTLEFLELSCRKSIKTPSKVTLRILSGKHQSYKNERSNLSKALKEVQNLGSLDLQMMKGELNFYRKYCDNAAELMKDTDQKAPFATEVLKKGLPIIDRKLKRLLEEIQEKARTTYKESIGEGVEETARAVCKEVQKWEIGSQEEMTQKIEEVAYLLKTKVADLPENEKIQNKIESMRHQTNLVKQYETLLFLIGLIPTMKVIPENALDQKLHYIKEDLKGELEDAKDEIISEIVSAKEEIITEIVNFKNKLNCMSFNISHIC